ncbi:MAG: peptide-methionine (S)-S-oxide reductase MsrA [Spirochaetales bacterium]|nr:MAG: peptide-methionine (S)-S-oxide reductase MsrA [Spirochaetales bacterium]
MKKETAILGGGCFWCVEAVFENRPGILSAVSGYAGGKKVNPSYEEVCTGTTGHAEVVRIEYDTAVISYGEVLGLFFKAHDPTSLNRQGADTGTQYRSIILYSSPEQKKEAEAVITETRKYFSRPLVTEVAELDAFYAAEDHHQDYYAKNPNGGYCTFVIRPKLKKLGLE